MTKIVFATHNENKLKEFREIVGEKIKILSLKDINCIEDIEESGNTLEENAFIKAKYVKDNYGYDCFSDDSGLEVDSLNNQPGVFSARYAGSPCDSEANIKKLLFNLQNNKKRDAQFRTIISLIFNKQHLFFDGIIRGTITLKKIGKEGFGYDPIFIPNGYDKTFAELGNDIKNKISHRSIATQKLISFLLQN